MSPTDTPASSTARFSNAYLLLIVAALGWGGNAVAGKIATGGWDPFTLTCIRWLLVTVLLLPFTWKHLKKDKELLRSRGWILLALGAFGMALFNMCMFLALNYTSAINISIEQAAMPVFIILANFLVLSQRVSILQIVGLLVATFGVVITATEGEPLKILAAGVNRGDVIMLLGCVFYAAYTFGLRWRPKVHWLTFMFGVALGAFLMTIPFSLFELSRSDVSLPAMRDWLVVLYIITVPSIICQLCFARSVELIGGNRAGLFINLVPIFGSLLAVLILSEQFRWFHMVGMVMVIGGIMLAEKFAAVQQ